MARKSLFYHSRKINSSERIEFWRSTAACAPRCRRRFCNSAPEATAAVATAKRGTCNATLFREAVSLAELVAGDVLSEECVWRELLAAARVAGLERFEISVTLASAFRQSRASPAGRYAPSYVMEISASATIEIARPREAVFDFACSNDTYERLFRKRGPVAGVVKATMADGAAPADGARRRIELSDGSVVDEIIVSWDRPARHTYRWSGGLKGLGGMLVRSGEADWTFREHGGKTSIDWVYRFVLTTPLVFPAVLVMRRQFRLWMEQQLRAIAAELEA